MISSSFFASDAPVVWVSGLILVPRKRIEAGTMRRKVIQTEWEKESKERGKGEGKGKEKEKEKKRKKRRGNKIEGEKGKKEHGGIE